MRSRWLTLAAALLALAAAGCGGDDSPKGDRPVSLILDFTPNAAHAGIYLARARGLDADAGVPLRIREPSQSTDSVTQLVSGRADFAILDIHDLALAREKGSDVVGIMAIVQTPLAAVIARPGITSPKQLEGLAAGVSGLPSDVAVLRSVVEGAGGDPSSVRRVTIGFTAVRSLLAGKVDAVTAFWNVEGVALAARRKGYRQFRVERFGAPAYPELVLAASRRTLRSEPDLARATIDALRRGYEDAQADPAAAIDALRAADPSLRATALRAQLAAIAPSFESEGDRFGELDRQRLRAWASWERLFGITERAPDIDRAFAFEL